MNNTELIIRYSFIDDGKDYDEISWAVTVSMFGVGGLIGSLFSALVSVGLECANVKRPTVTQLTDRVGRRNTILLNNIPVFIATGLMSFSPQW